MLRDFVELERHSYNDGFILLLEEIFSDNSKGYSVQIRDYDGKDAHFSTLDYTSRQYAENAYTAIIKGVC